MSETTYRGYRIRYYCADTWYAQVYAPNWPLTVGYFPMATIEEGEHKLLKLAKECIDAELTKAN